MSRRCVCKTSQPHISFPMENYPVTLFNDTDNQIPVVYETFTVIPGTLTQTSYEVLLTSEDMIVDPWQTVTINMLTNKKYNNLPIHRMAITIDIHDGILIWNNPQPFQSVSISELVNWSRQSEDIVNFIPLSDSSEYDYDSGA